MDTPDAFNNEPEWVRFIQLWVISVSLITIGRIGNVRTYITNPYIKKMNCAIN